MNSELARIRYRLIIGCESTVRVEVSPGPRREISRGLWSDSAWAAAMTRYSLLVQDQIVDDAG